jgi:hypothetical protein
MHVGGVVVAAHVVVVLDAIGVLVSDHFSCHWADVLLQQEAGNIDYSDVAELVPKDQLASGVPILLFWLIFGRDKGNLGGFLNTVHILPLRQQIARVFKEVLGGKDVNGALHVHYHQQRQRINE